MPAYSSLAILSAMPVHPARVLALQLQTPDADSSRLMVIFMGIAAVSLLVLALVVLGVLAALVIVALKARKAAATTLEEVKAKVYPLVATTHGLVTDLSPTIKSITAKVDTLVGELTPSIKGITEKTHSLIEDLSPRISGITEDVHGVTSRAVDMAEFAKVKFYDFAPVLAAAKENLTHANDTAHSAAEMTSHQVERVNHMITGVLDWTEQIPLRLQQGLNLPGRKLGETIKQLRGQGFSFFSATSAFWKGLAEKRSKPKSSPAHSSAPAQAPESPHAPVSVVNEEVFAVG